MLRKTIFIIMLGCLLPACIPAAFVAGASAGGAIIYDKRPLKIMITDRNIANTALNNLNNDPTLKTQTRISVAVFNGIVLMLGEAPTAELRDRAYAIVNAVPGIRRIYNEVTIAPPISNLAQANDSWLTTKIKSQMLAEKGLHSSQIKVVTENSIVYLMGVTGRNQAQLAIDVARQVNGVQKVVTLFEYD